MPGSLNNLIVDSQTLEASLAPLTSAVGGYLSASTPEAKSAALTTLESAVAGTASAGTAFASDVSSYVEDNPFAKGALLASGALSIASGLIGLQNDFNELESDLQNGTPVPLKLQLALSADVGSIGAGSVVLAGGGGELGAAGLGLVSVVSGLSTAAGAISSLMPAPASTAVAPSDGTPSTAVTFSNGYTGGWIANNDGTSTFQITDAGGQVTNAVTITTPAGSLPTITGSGGTITSDAGVQMNISNTGALSETEDGDVPISVGSEVLPFSGALVQMQTSSTGAVISSYSDTTGDNGSSSQSANGSTSSSTLTTNSNNDATTSTTGDLFTGDLTGSQTVNGVSFNTTNPVFVTGSDQTFNASQLGAGALFDFSGGNTLTTGGSTGVSLIGGAGDTLIGSNDGGSMVVAGSGVQVNSTGESVIASANEAFSLIGGGNTISAISDSITIADIGTANDLNSTGSSIDVSGSASLDLTGSNNSTQLSSNNLSLTDGGENEIVTLSGTNDNATATGLGDRLTVDGSGATVSLSNGQITLAAGLTSGLVIGSGDVVSEDASDDGAINYGGTSGTDTVNWTNVTDGGPLSWQISFDPSAGVADQTSDWTGAGATGAKVDQIDDWSGGGSQLTEYDPQSGVSSIVADYTGGQASGTETDETDDFTAGYSQYTQYDPNASETSVTYGYSAEDRTGTKEDELIDWSAGGSQLQAFDPGYGLQSVTFNFTGAGAAGEVSTEDLVGNYGYSEDVSFDYDGSGDVTAFQEAYYDGSTYLGTDDFNGYGQLTGYSGALGGGGFGDGGSDGGNPGDYGYGSGGNYGGYGYGYGGYDLASPTAGRGKGISEIAAYDLNHGKLGAAAAAESALFQAKLTAQSSAGSGVLAPETHAAKWSSTTITWSFAAGSGTTAAPISGAIGTRYQALIEQAFATWAKATGLNFVQAASPSQADIQIGWGNFDTASSGVLGYTTSPASGGALQAGAIIRLEDPSQNTLATDANGQLSYTGTDAELSQLILHEIGHAIGLGDSADPRSVMYSVANDQDRSISSSDVAAVQALYDDDDSATTQAVGSRASPSAASSRSTASSSGFSIDANQLIQAMAGFNLSPTELPWEPVSHGAILTGASLLAASSQLHAA